MGLFISIFKKNSISGKSDAIIRTYAKKGSGDIAGYEKNGGFFSYHHRNLPRCLSKVDLFRVLVECLSAAIELD
ncbi:MAG: hypothetical protein APR55_08935 [Methanolinea sp. SDB]|nr:MAG: hypothetical protein APR55_08935 [Methanolinea sp. SDB]